MKSLFCVGTINRWAFGSKVHLPRPSPTGRTAVSRRISNLLSAVRRGTAQIAAITYISDGTKVKVLSEQTIIHHSEGEDNDSPEDEDRYYGLDAGAEDETEE